MSRGIVYLIGAGPGDPGLITVRGRAALMKADVVLYDRLGTEALMHLCRPDARLVDVGKAPDRVAMTQDDTTALCVELGRQGLVVARLKGGDPYVFGRGGEEAQALIDAEVPFDVVPGISSAVGVPAAAGIPVTHRNVSVGFTVVTGHREKGGATSINWEALAQVGGTIVVLMGVSERAEIATRLMSGGLASDTPVAAIRYGTRPEQTTIRTTLGELADAPLESPSTIVIGQVAAFDFSPTAKTSAWARKAGHASLD